MGGISSISFVFLVHSAQAHLSRRPSSSASFFALIEPFVTQNRSRTGGGEGDTQQIGTCLLAYRKRDETVVNSFYGSLEGEIETQVKIQSNSLKFLWIICIKFWSHDS